MGKVYKVVLIECVIIDTIRYKCLCFIEQLIGPFLGLGDNALMFSSRESVFNIAKGNTCID